MRVITKEEYINQREAIIRQIAQGALFIYPTDTIYRLGCDATNPHAIKRLRKLKNSYVPFSIIAPSKRWIRLNCDVTDDHDDAIDLLPGRHMLIVGLKKQNSISRDVLYDKKTLGVRIPSHWSQELAAFLNRPIICTAANITGQSYMTTLDDLAPQLRKEVDLCLYEGEIPKRRTINVIDLTKELKPII